jgi:hypothetical protein
MALARVQNELATAGTAKPAPVVRFVAAVAQVRNEQVGIIFSSHGVTPRRFGHAKQTLSRFAAVPAGRKNNKKRGKYLFGVAEVRRGMTSA